MAAALAMAASSW